MEELKELTPLIYELAIVGNNAALSHIKSNCVTTEELNTEEL